MLIIDLAVIRYLTDTFLNNYVTTYKFIVIYNNVETQDKNNEATGNLRSLSSFSTCTME